MAAYVKSGFAVEPGTHEQVLLLAEPYKKPMGDAGNKTNVWSPKRIFYIYYSDEVLATRAKEDFTPYAKSKKHHFSVGLNKVAAKAPRATSLSARASAPV